MFGSDGFSPTHQEKIKALEADDVGNVSCEEDEVEDEEESGNEEDAESDNDEDQSEDEENDVHMQEDEIEACENESVSQVKYYYCICILMFKSSILNTCSINLESLDVMISFLLPFNKRV